MNLGNLLRLVFTSSYRNNGKNEGYKSKEHKDTEPDAYFPAYGKAKLHKLRKIKY